MTDHDLDDNVASVLRSLITWTGRVLVTLLKSPVAWGVLVLAFALLEARELIHVPVVHDLIDAVGSLALKARGQG